MINQWDRDVNPRTYQDWFKDNQKNLQGAINDPTRFQYDDSTGTYRAVSGGQGGGGGGLPFKSIFGKTGGVGGKMSWLDLASAGANAYSSYANSKAQKEAAQKQADLYNDWMKQYQQMGSDLYGQAQAGGWNPFGPKVSTSSGTTSSSGGGSFNNRPVITAQYQPLDELMRGIMTGRLSGGSSLPAGYASTAARGINESFEGADAAARNMAARRGLSGEQTYAVASPANRARAGALADMRANLPLLERQMQNEDIGITQGLQSAFGTGQAGTSSQYSSGSNQGMSTMPFTANDLSSIMSVLMPPGPQQSGMTGTSTSGAVVDSLGMLMGLLASQQAGRTPNYNGGYGAAGAPPTPYGYG